MAAGQRSADVMSVVAVVAGFVLSLGLALGAFVTSLCSLFGTRCTPAEEQLIGLLLVSSVGVFLLVPVIVAGVRRQARWLLAPVVEAFLVVAVIAAVDWF